MFVDSHCHLDQLDLTPYDGDLNRALQSAQDNGVMEMLCVNIDLEHFPDVLAIAKAHDFIKASVGVHPTTELAADNEPSLERLCELADDDNIVAIGETGLDYFHIPPRTDWQLERFRTHIKAGQATQKPIIIHTRDAREDTLTLMREENANAVGGVMHCFTETWEMAEAAMALNFYISISGIVTFKNAKQLQDVATRLPLDKLLIETDAPYLAPTPYRGKPNEPKFVRHVAEFIAELRGESIETIAAVTTDNYHRLFG